MWNVYGGLYAEADLYASLEREGWTRISARLSSTRSIIARSIKRHGEPFNFHAPIRRISGPRDSRDLRTDKRTYSFLRVSNEMKGN